MTIANTRPFGQRYAFVVVGVIFLALLISSGLRSAPSVMMVPLEEAFGWRRDTISFATAIGIFLYGLAGPFAAAFMERFGLRKTILGALALMSASTALSLLMSQPWHLIATWGVMSGVGTGAVATVLGATVTNRWFKTNRGLVMGLMSASSATGLLVFLPFLAMLAQSGGWKPVAIAVSIATAALLPLVFLLVPERPASIGLRRYGAEADEPPVAMATGNFLINTFSTLGRAARTRVFWYLFLTFFVCGFTTNGLVGTHLIAFCGDMGIPEVQAAGLLALMGVFDLIGTTLSGNLLTMAAMRACLGEVMTEISYLHMTSLAATLADGLEGALRSRGLPWCVIRLGTRVELVFRETPPRNGAEAREALDPLLERALHLYLMNRGVIVTPFHNMMLVSPATTGWDVERLVTLMGEAFDILTGEAGAVP